MYVLEDTGGSSGGTSDYTDLENKPSINGVTLEGNLTTQELDVDKHFKGWYDSLNELKATHTATQGDSAYVKDASPDTTWSIYVYDSTASSDNYWADSGTNADTSNVQTFASGEEVNETPIDDTHLVNAPEVSLPLATDVQPLAQKTKGLDFIEQKVAIVSSGDGQNRYAGFYVNGVDSKIGTSSGVSSTNSVLVVNVNGWSKVRFLGITTVEVKTVGWGFCSSEPTVANNTPLDLSGVFDSGAETAAAKEYVVDVPTGMNYLVVTIREYNNEVLSLDDFYCYLQKGATIDDVKNSINGEEGFSNITIELIANKCYRTDNSNPVDVTTLSGCYCGEIGNVAGRTFKFYGEGHASTNQIPLVYFRSVGGTLISSATVGGKHRDGVVVTAPSNAYFMQFNFVGYNAAIDKVQEYGIIDNGLRQDIETRLDGTKEWQEITPTLYAGYYNQNNRGIGISSSTSTEYKCFRIEGVKAGDKYRVWGVSSTAVRLVLFKQGNGSNITDGSSSPAAQGATFTKVPFVATVPNNAYYMCVSYRNYDATVNKIEKLVDVTQGIEDVAVEAAANAKLGNLIGKKVVFFGDSITQFTQSGRNIPAWFGEYSGAIVTSGAIGGTRFVPRPSSETYNKLDIPNMIDAWIAGDFTDQLADAANTNAKQTYTEIINNLAATTPAATDIVMIGGGTNDMSSGSPIGESTDTTIASVLGSMAHIVTALLTANPRLKIYFYSPVVGKHGDPLTFDDTYVFPLINKTKPEVIELMAAQAKKYHVPYIDLYWSMGWNEINFSTYFTQSGDYSHPYGGFNALARRLYGQVKALME